MFSLSKIELKNFGPYYGTEKIDFDQNGITVIYGENGEGKSSLLAALNFVFTGKTHPENNRKKLLSTCINKHAISEGKDSCSVKVTVKTEEGKQYEITRVIRSKKMPPSNFERDYDKETHVRDLLTGAIFDDFDTEVILNNLISDEVSRFFIFDGELMDKYRELLGDSDSSGSETEIKSAIDQILGIPIINNTITDINKYSDELSKELKLDKSNNNKLRLLKAELAATLTQISNANNELNHPVDGYINKQKKYLAEKEIAEEEAKAHGSLVEINEKIQAIRKEENDIQKNEDNLRDDMSDQIENLWRLPFQGVIKSLEAQLQDYNEEINTQYIRQIVEQNTLELCQDCIQKAETVIHNKNWKGEMTTDLAGFSDAIELIGSMDFSNLSTLEKNLRKLSIDKKKVIDKYTTVGEITEKDEELSNDIQNKLITSTSAYNEISKSITDTIERRDGLNVKRDDILSRIDKLGDPDDKKTTDKINKINEYRDLFENSKESFRQIKKNNVEKSSSKIFKIITSNQSYTEMKINDNYGLEIFQGNESIPVASMGEFQTLALSFLGGIQKNITNQGPAILDSPFIRLDKTHTSKVIEGAKEISHQVIFLAFEKELPRENLKKISNLTVYKLDRSDNPIKTNIIREKKDNF